MTELRDKDIAILRAIHAGASTVAEIGEATTLTNREINYSLTEYSLHDMGLVRVDRETGREWREFDGTERFVWKPKHVELTDRGIQQLSESDSNPGAQYEDVSKRELAERVVHLEERLERLEQVFKDFRESVMQEL